MISSGYSVTLVILGVLGRLLSCQGERPQNFYDTSRSRPSYIHDSHSCCEKCIVSHLIAFAHRITIYWKCQRKRLTNRVVV